MAKTVIYPEVSMILLLWALAYKSIIKALEY